MLILLEQKIYLWQFILLLLELFAFLYQEYSYPNKYWQIKESELYYNLFTIYYQKLFNNILFFLFKLKLMILMYLYRIY